MRNLTFIHRLDKALQEDGFADGITGQRGGRKGVQDRYQATPSKSEVDIHAAEKILASLIKNPPPRDSEEEDKYMEILDLLETFKDRLISKEPGVTNYDYTPDVDERIASTLKNIRANFDREHIKPLERTMEQAHTSAKGKLRVELEQLKLERDRQLKQYETMLRNAENAKDISDEDLAKFNLDSDMSGEELAN